MDINLVPDSSVSSAPAGFTAAIQAAAEIFDQDFPGNYTVNIRYGWGTYDNVADDLLTSRNSGFESIGGVIAGDDETYATVRSWLIDHATLSDQKTAIASLPASDDALPGGANSFFVSNAQEKALGVYTGSSSAIDGAIGFVTSDQSDTDFTGLAICEIAHALGWFSGQDDATIMDLFRYSSPGQYQWTGGEPAYFSVDGGATDLANFGTAYDTTLFENIDNDPMVFPQTGSPTNLTSLDIEVLNDIGFGGAQPKLTIAGAGVLTDGTSLTIGGRIDAADAGSTVSIFDGTADWGAATPQADGEWTATVTPPGNGVYVLTVEATNELGLTGISSAADFAIGGGQTIDFTGASGNAASLYNSNGDWDFVNGAGGTVYLTSAQAEVTGGGDTIDFSSGSGNAVGLYSTGTVFDAVDGSGGMIALTHAYTGVTGGGDAIYFEGAANVASLSDTGGVFDAVYGSGGLVGLNNAFAEVTGGGDAVNFAGASGNVAALYSTAGVWDGVTGSNGEVVLTNAYAELFGGGDTVYLEGGPGNALAIYNSGGQFDNVNGSNALVVLTNAYAEVAGGGDSVYFEGASGNVAALYGAGGVYDGVNGSNGEVVLTNAQAEITGGGNTIYLEGSGNTAALYNTGASADAVNGSNDTVVLTKANATVTGGGDSIYFSGTNSVTANGASDAFVFQPTIGEDTINGFAATDTMQFSASDFTSFSALQSHTTQSGANTVIALDATDTVTLTSFTATNLVASEFHFV